MGGLPKDAPPRPGTPEYDEFERKQEAERARDKSRDPQSDRCKKEKAISIVQQLKTDQPCSADNRAAH